MTDFLNVIKSLQLSLKQMNRKRTETLEKLIFHRQQRTSRGRPQMISATRENPYETLTIRHKSSPDALGGSCMQKIFKIQDTFSMF